MKGHLKEPSADTRVRAGVSVSLSRNSSQKPEVLRQRFATQKPLKIKGMRPSRGTLDFCDTWLAGNLRTLQESKWPLVTRLLGLPLYTVFKRFDLDPCSPRRTRPPVKARMHYTAEDDGLSLPWHGTVFVNPPYGRQLPAWIAKAHAELEHGNARLVVALIPARTDTAYWHRHVAGHADVYFLKGRLRFGQNGQSAPFPSALAVWGADAATLARLDAAFPEAWRMGR
jgi:hypothetical protein